MLVALLGIVTDVIPLQPEKALVPIEVNFSEKRIIPLPLLKLCDLMEVLKAFVCNPDSWAFVTSDN